MKISSNRLVHLEPMILKDLEWFFEVATISDGSKFWYGNITGYPLPAFDQFKKDYIPAYFSDEREEIGRCFSIYYKGKRIGVIAYNEIEVKNNQRTTEIDIIIADNFNMGKGLGVLAISELADYLFSRLSIDIIFLLVPVDNPRAYYAYVKAGFKEVKKKAMNGKIWLKMELHNKTQSRPYIN